MYTNNLRKQLKRMGFLLSIIALIIFSLPARLFAQDQSTAKEQVRNTFEYSKVINSQTVEGQNKHSLDFLIEHRFGTIGANKEKDLFGVFASSNIALNLNYGITNRLSVGVSATKYRMTYGLEWKYVLLKQEKPTGIPVTVTYYGNLDRSADSKDFFVDQDNVYKASDRISYFHELMIARKFNGHLSLQVGVTYTHFNLVDSSFDNAGINQTADHDFFNASFVGRYKFSPQSSIIADCSLPFKQRSFGTEKVPQTSLGLGVEISTGSHQFQLFICNASAILNPEIAVYNANKINDKGLLLGFNITRQWGLK